MERRQQGSSLCRLLVGYPRESDGSKLKAFFPPRLSRSQAVAGEAQVDSNYSHSRSDFVFPFNALSSAVPFPFFDTS